MTDHSCSPINMQLYHELKNMFPSVPPNTLAEIINKNGCHRLRCIEDLCGGQYNLPSQVGNFSQHHNHQALLDNRPYGSNPGTRSHSVSGVPGATSAEESRGYGYGYQVRGRLPQTAPVLPGAYFPFPSGGDGFSFSNSGSSEGVNSGYPLPQYASVGSHECGAPLSLAAGPASIARPTKVSSPRHPYPYSHFPGVGDGPRQQYGFYPVLNKLSDGPLPSTASQPVRHTSTLNVIPGTPPPYGWSPSVGMHSTSVNLQLGASSNDSHPKVQIITSGNMNYAGGDATTTMASGNAPPWLGTQVTSSSPQQPSVPYQSQLCISISPNGGSISAMRSQMHSPLSQPPQRYHANQVPLDRHSPINVGLTPTYVSSPEGRLSTSTQASPRTSPKIAEETFTKGRSIFDQDDPEQEKVTQTPLKPVPSPVSAASWNVGPAWPPNTPAPSSLAPGNELYSGEAYSRALLMHQQQKFCTLRRELDREKVQLQDIRGEVARVELYFYQQVHCKDQIFFSFDDLQRLRSEVRSLMVDCACMTRLVDLLHRGEVPLGETNEEFYKTINTGQQGPVLPNVRASLRAASQAAAHEVTSRPSMPLPTTPPQPQRTSSLQEVAQPTGMTQQPTLQQEDDEEGQKWACCTCTFHNNPAMVICEMCEMPKFVQGEATHNFRIQVRQNSTCAAASKALQLKLTHRLGAVKR